MDILIMVIGIIAVLLVILYLILNGLRVVILKFLKIEKILGGVTQTQADLKNIIDGLNKIEQNNEKRYRDIIYKDPLKK